MAFINGKKILQVVKTYNLGAPNLYRHNITMTVINDSEGVIDENATVSFLAYLPTAEPLETEVDLLDVVDYLILNSKTINANETNYIVLGGNITEDRDLFIMVKNSSNVQCLYGIIDEFTINDIVS